MNKPIPHSRPQITSADIAAVTAVLRRNYVGQGAQTRRLESLCARAAGRRFALATVNGTFALKVALRALGLKKKARVATSAYVCPAVVNVIKELGYVPRFVDVRKGDLSIDIARLNHVLRSREKPAAVVIPHVAGFPVDLSPLRAGRVPVIEDCGPTLVPPARGCIAVYSFGSTKMVTAGSGGMAVTDSAALYARMKVLMRYDDLQETVPAGNGTMNDVQAALAASQMRRLAQTVRARAVIAGRYTARLRSLPRAKALCRAAGDTTNYRYVFLTQDNQRVVRSLRRCGVDARTSVAPCVAARANALRLGRELVSLPIYPGLTRREQARIIAALETALGKS